MKANRSDVRFFPGNVSGITGVQSALFAWITKAPWQ